LGIRRETEVLTKRSTISLMGERQRHRPWGLMGGRSGSPGEYGIARGNKMKALSSKTTFSANAGDVLTVTTPGGGGYGTPSKRTRDKIRQDRADGKS
jgi:N-methylhydantoinase B